MKTKRWANWIKLATKSRLSRPSAADAFEHVDFTFFCGTESLTRKHWREALRAGSTVLDLTGALDQETGVLVRSPVGGGAGGSADLFTPAVVPAHPAALALALLMERLQQAAPVRQAAATVLLPASEFGRAGDGRTAPADGEPAELPVNAAGDVTTRSWRTTCSAGWARTPRRACSSLIARIRRHYEALAGRSAAGAGAADDQCAGFSRSCVFHCCGAGAAGRDLSALEEALSGDHVDLVLEDTDSPSNLAATGQNDVLVRLRPEPGPRNANESSRVWLWAASDNLRLYAQNAVECALDLRRLRPQGTVQ